MNAKLVIAAAVTTGLLFSAGAASAYERWIEVVNHSNVAIESIYITHVDDPSFGRRDLLGTYMISPGDSMVVEPRNPQGYCRFDILVVYENGYEERFFDINLCEETTLSV